MDIMGERIYLRKMKIEDTDQVIAWRNAPHVMEQFIYRTPLTRETHLEWIRTKVDTGKVQQFIICIKENDRGIGSFYLRDIDLKMRTAELGIFIGEQDALGKGYGTEAVRLGVSYGFRELHLERIILRVYQDNINAVRNYEKNGFVLMKDRTETVERDGCSRTVIFMQKEKEASHDL
ncbi:MAG: GNAT family N-acetyltransferase [Lachnospiraceae bacterium]|nr:GNAT family N-acetyltransferase [Lachnospiraceae bacterium]